MKNSQSSIYKAIHRGLIISISNQKKDRLKGIKLVEKLLEGNQKIAAKIAEEAAEEIGKERYGREYEEKVKKHNARIERSAEGGGKDIDKDSNKDLKSLVGKFFQQSWKWKMDEIGSFLGCQWSVNGLYMIKPQCIPIVSHIYVVHNPFTNHFVTNFQ